MRLRVVVLLALIAGGLTWVATNGLSRTVVYFVTPTELSQMAGDAGERLRLGGQVVPGSIDRSDGTIAFTLTDGPTRIRVLSRGGAPALFRAGSGVVVEGIYTPGGIFRSDNILIKHSADYRPPAPGEEPQIDTLQP